MKINLHKTLNNVYLYYVVYNNYIIYVYTIYIICIVFILPLLFIKCKKMTNLPASTGKRPLLDQNSTNDL